MQRIKKNMSLVLAIAATSLPAVASSHREAPAIANTQALDNTDVYAFQSKTDASKVSLIMNVSPGDLPSAGPNWYRFDDKAIYEMHIDNVGDGRPHITYRFQFTTANTGKDADVLTHLPQIKFVNGRYTYALNQTYSLLKIVSTYERDGDRRDAVTTIKDNVPVAPTRVGPETTDYNADGTIPGKDDTAAMYQNYKRLQANAIVTTKDGKYEMFAGPANDPFFVDLGGIFDALSIRIKPLGVDTGDPVDGLAGLNCLTMALEVPAAETGKQFGVWATVSYPQDKPIFTNDGYYSIVRREMVQVSRLGNPLVNEVVIGVKDKDNFNRTEPKDDAKLYANYVLNPELASLLNALYGKAGGAKAKLLDAVSDKNRTDLVAAFVTGIPGINQIPGATGSGDMLRVNLNLPAKLQHWPISGRTLEDDVVKSALTFLAQCNKITEIGIDNPYGKWDSATSVNCALDDALTADDKTPGGAGHSASFPYMDLPFSSYGQAHK